MDVIQILRCILKHHYKVLSTYHFTIFRNQKVNFKKTPKIFESRSFQTQICSIDRQYITMTILYLIWYKSLKNIHSTFQLNSISKEKIKGNFLDFPLSYKR